MAGIDGFSIPVGDEQWTFYPDCLPAPILKSEGGVQNCSTYNR